MRRWCKVVSMHFADGGRSLWFVCCWNLEWSSRRFCSFEGKKKWYMVENEGLGYERKKEYNVEDGVGWRKILWSYSGESYVMWVCMCLHNENSFIFFFQSSELLLFLVAAERGTWGISFVFLSVRVFIIFLFVLFGSERDVGVWESFRFSPFWPLASPKEEEIFSIFFINYAINLNAIFWLDDRNGHRLLMRSIDQFELMAWIKSKKHTKKHILF